MNIYMIKEFQSILIGIQSPSLNNFPYIINMLTAI
jgi:hypothetical protein